MAIEPDKDEGVLVYMLQWFDADGPDVAVEARGAAVRRREQAGGGVVGGRDGVKHFWE